MYSKYTELSRSHFFNSFKFEFVLDKDADPYFNDCHAFPANHSYLYTYIFECAAFYNRTYVSNIGRHHYPTGNDLFEDLADLRVNINFLNNIYAERRAVNPCLVEIDICGNIRRIGGFDMMTPRLTYEQFKQELERSFRKNVCKLIDPNCNRNLSLVYIDEQV